MTKQSTALQRGKPLDERFWEKVRKADGCWLWDSAIGSRGYGVFWIGGAKRNEHAHRMAYILTKGAIPDGLYVLHSCDNPKCVNPAHLSVGTAQDNSTDRVVRGRSPAGSKNYSAKLNEAQIVEIKAALAAGETHRAIAARYSVTKSTITRIACGRGWRGEYNDMLGMRP